MFVPIALVFCLSSWIKIGREKVSSCILVTHIYFDKKIEFNIHDDTCLGLKEIKR